MHDLPPEQVALRRAIRELRRERGLTQEGLGQRCGMQLAYVGRVERGEINVSWRTLTRIADGLGERAGCGNALPQYGSAHQWTTHREPSSGDRADGGVGRLEVDPQIQRGSVVRTPPTARDVDEGWDGQWRESDPEGRCLEAPFGR